MSEQLESTVSEPVIDEKMSLPISCRKKIGVVIGGVLLAGVTVVGGLAGWKHYKSELCVVDLNQNNSPVMVHSPDDHTAWFNARFRDNTTTVTITTSLIGGHTDSETFGSSPDGSSVKVYGPGPEIKYPLGDYVVLVNVTPHNVTTSCQLEGAA